MISPTTPPPPANGSDHGERRRNRRFHFDLPAVIHLADVHDLACDIRDFCIGGLFLRFVHPDIAIGVLARRANAQIEIAFTCAEAAVTLRLVAQVRRLAPQGVGVAFGQPVPEVLRVLQRQRMAALRHRLGKRVALLPRPQLVAAARALLVDMLDQTFDQIDGTLETHLEVAAMRAMGIAEHSALQHAPRQFVLHRAAIRAALSHYVLQRLDRPDTLPGTQPAEPSGDLALVDEADFEDRLNVTTEATRVEETFHAELVDIGPRLALLTGYSFDRGNNPFSPGVVFHGYRAALQPIKLAAQVRQVAYLALRETLQESLIPFYAELLAVLPPAEHRVLPRNRIAQRDTAGAPANNRPAGAFSKLTDTLVSLFRGDANVATDSGSPHAATFGHAVAPSGAGSQAAHPEAHPGSRSGSTAAAPQPVPPLGSSVLQRLADRGVLPTNMDRNTVQSVNFFAALLETLERDRGVGAGAKPFFRDLETTLVKLALNDTGFLTSPAHPAHKVLNTLDRLSRLAGDAGEISDQRLLRLLRRWTERINAEAENNPGIFDEAGIQLERVITPMLRERAARVFRLQELCEGRQHAEKARRRVVGALYDRLGNQPVAQMVVDLWNGGWRSVLVMAELRGEADTAWNVIETLHGWLEPGSRSVPTPDAIQRLLRDIDARLAEVCADKPAQDRLLDQLSAVLFAPENRRQRHTTLDERLDETPTAFKLNETQSRLAARLRVGDWLEFAHQAVPLNLIWVGDQPPVYVFANYRGDKKLDLKQADLLRALSADQARWTDDLELPLIDRTYSAIILKMQSDLARQAETDPQTGLLRSGSFLRAQRRSWVRLCSGHAGYMVGVIQFDPAADVAMVELARALRAALPDAALVARTHSRTFAWWQPASSRDEALTQSRAVKAALTAHAAPHAATARDGDAASAPAIGVIWRTDCVDAERDFERARDASQQARGTPDRLVLAPETSDDYGSGRLHQWQPLIDSLFASERLSLICHPAVASTGDPDTVDYHELYLHVDTRSDQLIPARDLAIIAERLGRQSEFDRWMADTAVAWLRTHADPHGGPGGFAVPISAQALADPEYLIGLTRQLESGTFAPARLIFMLTEATAIEGHARTQHVLRQLQRYGCRFMLDQFVGHSAYPYLKSLQLDFIKFDRRLTRDLETSEVDQALVRSIVETSRYLGIRTVAGTVENPLLREKLAALGVDLVQGYSVATPRLLEELTPPRTT